MKTMKEKFELLYLPQFLRSFNDNPKCLNYLFDAQKILKNSLKDNSIPKIIKVDTVIWFYFIKMECTTKNNKTIITYFYEFK